VNDVIAYAGSYMTNKLMATLRSVASGGAREVDVTKLEPEAQLEHYLGRLRKLTAARRWFQQQCDAAHRNAQAAERDRWEARRDVGARDYEQTPADRDAVWAAFQAACDARRGELDLSEKGGFLEEINTKIGATEDALLLLYRQLGVPQEAQRLRQRVAEALTEAMVAESKFRASAKAFNETGGVRGTTPENVPQGLHAAIAPAAGRAAALRAELRDQYGLSA